ncbi:MAG: radical SAM protein [Kiritimatiellae bacterium]|nr:radical SAM protein [Kiritimatiellia bacterium]
MNKRNDTIRFASIIVTYRCNARCHMCHTWQHPTDPAEEIGAADLARLPDIPTLNVTGGEPFLRDDLPELLDVLRGKARRVVVSTNGYLTDRIVEVARRHPWIGVRVSIEGLPKANDELRGLPDGFDHGLRTLLALHRMGLKDIGFGITLSDRNVADLLDLYTLSQMMGLEFATAAVHNAYYFHKTDNRFERPDAAVEALEKLIDALLRSRRPKDWFRAYFNHGLIEYIRGNPRLLPCAMGGESFFLDPYGEIRPCNVMERSMGNIRQRDFRDIWRGPEAEAIRREVAGCGRHCWMIGSAAEPIKRNPWTVLRWILRRKLLSPRVRNKTRHSRE